jgi:hypothetical protein
MLQHFATHAELKQAFQGFTPTDILTTELHVELAQDILNHDPINRVMRASNVTKLAKDIDGGFWDPRKSGFIRFSRDGRLLDGQHRCQAVIQTGKSIIVHIVVVDDTIGLDQGVNRTLSDQLKIHHHLDNRHECDLAAAVNKAICQSTPATDREQIETFHNHRDFILECVHKPLSWLADKEISVLAVMKPNLLAVLRARHILLEKQPPTEVDQLLEDMVNGGHTAPEGSARKANARQLWDLMQKAHSRRVATFKTVNGWVETGLGYNRQGITKSIEHARRPKKTPRKGRTDTAAD